jgi:hypothetical protein
MCEMSELRITWNLALHRNLSDTTRVPEEYQ